jgi:hypothetical protein
MRFSSRLSLAIVPAVAVLVGCSANVVASPEIADAETGPSSAAFVEVTRTSTGDQSRAVARFARVRGGPLGEGEMDLLRVGLTLPPLDSCAPATQAAAPDGPSPRAVELADVGSLTVEAGGTSTALTTRRMNVIDLVSGVVYWGEGPLPSRGRYELRASGRAGALANADPSLEVPAFVVSAQSPGEPQDVHVANGPSGLDVTWDPGSQEDVVYVDVAARGQTTTRCTFSDGGRATIPAFALGFADEGTLSIHRVHRESFRVRGIDRGEVRFDLARVVAFSRR